MISAMKLLTSLIIYKIPQLSVDSFCEGRQEDALKEESSLAGAALLFNVERVDTHIYDLCAYFRVFSKKSLTSIEEHHLQSLVGMSKAAIVLSVEHVGNEFEERCDKGRHFL